MSESETPYWIVTIQPDLEELVVSTSEGVRIATVHPHANAARHAALIGAAPSTFRLLCTAATFLRNLAERESGVVQETAASLARSLDASIRQIEEGTRVHEAFRGRAPD